MSLETGENIDGKVVAVLSITDNAIQRVETLRKTQQHIVQDPNPFEILVNDEDSENGDDEAQQILPDQIKIRDQKTQ